MPKAGKNIYSLNHKSSAFNVIIIIKNKQTTAAAVVFLRHFYPSHLLTTNKRMCKHSSPRLLIHPPILPAGFVKPSLLILLRSGAVFVCVKYVSSLEILAVDWRRASALPPCQARDRESQSHLSPGCAALTKDWPRASVLLFVSNALTRAVKLSGSLPLPSSVNNGTLHLAVLSDINKRGHKGGEGGRVPGTCEDCQAPARSQTKRVTNKQQQGEKKTRGGRVGTHMHRR